MTKPFDFEAFARENAQAEFGQPAKPTEQTGPNRPPEAGCIGTTHFWYYATARTLRCKKCGAVRYAPPK
jgi:hypothetical protein